MIALSLSGGGSRAAGFHLGVLDCLERLGLRNDIGILSSVSGGSFIGTTYTLAMHSGEAFEAYLHRMYGSLHGAQMVEWVLKELATGTFNSPSRRRSMVTALANVYDREFFFGARLSSFLSTGHGSIREAIFNATDFRTGDAFRFQIRGGVGNTNYDTTRDDIYEIDEAAVESRPFWVPEADAAHIRLADIMAASSCIPGAFEPFYFPQDFDWNSDGGAEAYQRILRRVMKKRVESIPLMDGGVYDNQCIESTLIALDHVKAKGIAVQDPTADREESRSPSAVARWLDQHIHSNPPTELDLFIVSDTSIESDPVYRAAYVPGDERPLKVRPPAQDGALTLAGMRLIWLALTTLSVLTLGSIAYHLFAAEHGRLDLSDLLLIFPLLLSAGALVVLVWYRAKTSAIIRGINRILQIEGPQALFTPRTRNSWVYLRTIPINLIGDLLSQRISSMFSLVNEIFMDRIRALGYALLRNSPLAEKVIANELRDLLKKRRPPVGMEWLTPSRQMTQLIKRAEEMPTAFWFERPDDLDVLIACGQITTYYNVLKHYGRLAAADGVITTEEQHMFDEGRKHWEQLQHDPRSMLRFKS